MAMASAWTLPTAPPTTPVGEYHLKANYTGVSFLYGGFLSKKCIATFAIGLGYATTPMAAQR